MISKEREFQKYFKEFPQKVIPKCDVIVVEYPLHSANDLLKGNFYLKNDINNLRYKSIGRIDIIFKTKRIVYCGEIKWSNEPNYNFWNSLKIIGYTSYFKWQTSNGQLLRNDVFRHTIKPAILMPEKSIKLEHELVSRDCKVALFGIIELENGFKLKLHK